ncbi:MAG TPA: 30S ribosomal protein S20 [bacterium]|nr:30S ribosomal protein S20 [bacterium]
MPQHRQFKKTLKVSEKSRQRNHAAKSRLATTIKKVKTSNSKDEAKEALKSAVSIIDLTASKGIIKKTTAARKKSRLYKLVAGME